MVNLMGCHYVLTRHRVRPGGPQFTFFLRQMIMKYAAHLQTPGLLTDAKPFGLFTCAKIGLLSAAGPLAIALLFVTVWIIYVPALDWTATGYKEWHAALGTRLGITLGLFVAELPFAVGLGMLLSHRRVTSYLAAGLTGAKVAACISNPLLAGMGFMICLASTGHNVMTVHDFAEMVGLTLVLLTKEIAAGASCGVIAAAIVRRLNRQSKPG